MLKQSPCREIVTGSLPIVNWKSNQYEPSKEDLDI